MTIDYLQAFGLVGGLASIAGLIYAIYYARQSRKVKLLVFERSSAIPLASAVSPEDDYSISVTFAREGEMSQEIKSVFVGFIRFANLGKEPVRRQDIAPANPIQVRVHGARLLDIALAGASREVCNIRVDKVSFDANESAADITFDYLDYNDGAVIKVLTEGRPKKVSLVGDVIGMPEGIRRSDEVRSLGLLNKIGFGLSFAFYIGAFVLTAFGFKWITGSWENFWVLLLPFVALFLPGIIIGIVASTIWPREDLKLPDALIFPRWYDLLLRRRLYASPHVPNHYLADHLMDDDDLLPENHNRTNKARLDNPLPRRESESED